MNPKNIGITRMLLNWIVSPSLPKSIHIFSVAPSIRGNTIKKENLAALALSTPKRIEVDIVVPAFDELIAELGKKGIEANMTELNKSKAFIELEIAHDSMMNFKYGVRAQPKIISDYLINEENAPDIGDEKIYIPVTYFNDGRKGYDIQYFTKEEVISDILKQYERFLSIISDQSNELYILSGN